MIGSRLLVWDPLRGRKADIRAWGPTSFLLHACLRSDWALGCSVVAYAKVAPKLILRAALCNTQPPDNKDVCQDPKALHQQVVEALVSCAAAGCLGEYSELIQHPPQPVSWSALREIAPHRCAEILAAARSRHAKHAAPRMEYANVVPAALLLLHALDWSQQWGPDEVLTEALHLCMEMLFEEAAKLAAERSSGDATMCMEAAESSAAGGQLSSACAQPSAEGDAYDSSRHQGSQAQPVIENRAGSQLEATSGTVDPVAPNGGGDAAWLSAFAVPTVALLKLVVKNSTDGDKGRAPQTGHDFLTSTLLKLLSRMVKTDTPEALATAKHIFDQGAAYIAKCASLQAPSNAACELVALMLQHEASSKHKQEQMASFHMSNFFIRAGMLQVAMMEAVTLRRFLEQYGVSVLHAYKQTFVLLAVLLLNPASKRVAPSCFLAAGRILKDLNCSQHRASALGPKMLKMQEMLAILMQSALLLMEASKGLNCIVEDSSPAVPFTPPNLVPPFKLSELLQLAHDLPGSLRHHGALILCRLLDLEVRPQHIGHAWCMFGFATKGSSAAFVKLQAKAAIELVNKLEKREFEVSSALMTTASGNLCNLSALRGDLDSWMLMEDTVSLDARAELAKGLLYILECNETEFSSAFVLERPNGHGGAIQLFQDLLERFEQETNSTRTSLTSAYNFAQLTTALRVLMKLMRCHNRLSSDREEPVMELCTPPQQEMMLGALYKVLVSYIHASGEERLRPDVYQCILSVLQLLDLSHEWEVWQKADNRQGNLAAAVSRASFLELMFQSIRLLSSEWLQESSGSGKLTVTALVLLQYLHAAEELRPQTVQELQAWRDTWWLSKVYVDMFVAVAEGSKLGVMFSDLSCISKTVGALMKVYSPEKDEYLANSGVSMPVRVLEAAATALESIQSAVAAKPAYAVSPECNCNIGVVLTAIGTGLMDLVQRNEDAAIRAAAARLGKPCSKLTQCKSLEKPTAELMATILAVISVLPDLMMVELLEEEARAKPKAASKAAKKRAKQAARARKQSGTAVAEDTQQAKDPTAEAIEQGATGGSPSGADEAAASGASLASTSIVLAPAASPGSSAPPSEPPAAELPGVARDLAAAERPLDDEVRQAGLAGSPAANQRPLVGTGEQRDMGEGDAQWQEVRNPRKGRRAGGLRLAAAETEGPRDQPGPSSWRKGIAGNAGQSTSERLAKAADSRPSARMVEGRPPSAEASPSRQAAVDLNRLRGADPGALQIAPALASQDPPLRGLAGELQAEVPRVGQAQARQPLPSPQRQQQPQLQVNSEREWPALGFGARQESQQQLVRREDEWAPEDSSAGARARLAPAPPRESPADRSHLASTRHSAVSPEADPQEALRGLLRQAMPPRQPVPLARPSAPRPAFPHPAFLEEGFGQSIFTDDEEEEPPPPARMNATAQSGVPDGSRRAREQLPPDGRGSNTTVRSQPAHAQNRAQPSRAASREELHGADAPAEEGDVDSPDEADFVPFARPRPLGRSTLEAEGLQRSGSGTSRSSNLGLSAALALAGMPLGVTPGGGGHGRAGRAPGAPAAAPIPGGGGHGGPRPTQKQALPSAPGRLVALDAIEDMVLCPITQEVMQDPVMAEDDHTYERQAIEQWLASNDTSPLTNIKLPSKRLRPNFTLRKIIAALSPYLD